MIKYDAHNFGFRRSDRPNTIYVYRWDQSAFNLAMKQSAGSFNPYIEKDRVLNAMGYLFQVLFTLGLAKAEDVPVQDKEHW
jgi:hypothetical protein